MSEPNCQPALHNILEERRPEKFHDLHSAHYILMAMKRKKLRSSMDAEGKKRLQNLMEER
jgi:hypothetical protein